VLVLAVAVEIPRMWRYLDLGGFSSQAGGIDAGDLGNLVGPLPWIQILGIWPSGDFRYPPPTDHWWLLDLRGLALVVVIGGALYLFDRRRNTALLAALGGAVIVWLGSARGQSPYVTAKSLVILSPFVLLVALRALLPETRPAWSRAGVQAMARIAAAAVVVAGVLWSAQAVLRGMPVESHEQRDQLTSLRGTVKDGPTLYMGITDFAGYRLRDVDVAYLGVGYAPPISVAVRPEKPWTFGQPLDWDNFDAKTLDRFRYVITIRGYDSQAPESFRRVRQTPLYEVWERTGPTMPRSTIETADEPAAPLDCKTPAGRRLRRSGGVAGVLRRAPLPMLQHQVDLGVGTSYQAGFTLPRGTWNLSARYTSEGPVRIMLDAERVAVLPPNTDRMGPYWPAGTVRSDGRPRQLVIVAEKQSRFAKTTVPTTIPSLVAVSADGERQIPLERACGRFIDWYRAR
jgi:hypothetical protein